MKNLVKFLGVCLFLVSITFVAEAEEKKMSKLKGKEVFDKNLTIKLAGFELGYQEGFQGVKWDCKFSIASQCDTDKQRFEPNTK
jgi:hypothetical protein